MQQEWEEKGAQDDMSGKNDTDYWCHEGVSNKDCGWLIAVLLRVKANGWYPPVSIALVQLLMEKVQCPLSTNCSRQSPIGIGRKSLHSYTTKLAAGGREGGREGGRGKKGESVPILCFPMVNLPFSLWLFLALPLVFSPCFWSEISNLYALY